MSRHDKRYRSEAMSPGESDALVPIIVEPVVEVGGNIDLLLFEIPSDSDT